MVSKFFIVTGEMGAGKSTVCNELGSLGFRVVKSDDLSKKVLYNMDDVRKELADQFGNDVILADGSLDIRKIKTRLFNPAYRDAYMKFENFLAVKMADYLVKTETEDIVIVEIPPIEPNGNLSSHMNIVATFFIPVDKETQMNRLRLRGLSDPEINERLALQSEQFAHKIGGQFVKLSGTVYDFGEPYKNFANEIANAILRWKNVAR